MHHKLAYHCFKGEFIHVVDVVKEEVNFRGELDTQGTCGVVVLTYDLFDGKLFIKSQRIKDHFFGSQSQLPSASILTCIDSNVPCSGSSSPTCVRTSIGTLLHMTQRERRDKEIKTLNSSIADRIA